MNTVKLKLMKTTGSLLIGVLITSLFFSCTSMKMTSYDDVYFNPKKQKAQEVVVVEKIVEVPTVEAQPQEQPVVDNSNENKDYQSESYKYEDENGDTYVTNNYYGDVDNYEDDDYYSDDYDYQYTRSIRKFYRHHHGVSYYDPFWYDPYLYNPYNYGWSYGFGYGWGYSYFYDPYYYNSWYYPYYYSYNPWYYSTGWGYHSYGWNGYYNNYWNGYHDGYWNGYHDNYWGGGYSGNNNNPFYEKKDYYGPGQSAGTYVSNRNVRTDEYFGPRKETENPTSGSYSTARSESDSKIPVSNSATRTENVISDEKATAIRNSDRIGQGTKTETSSPTVSRPNDKVTQNNDITRQSGINEVVPGRGEVEKNNNAPRQGYGAPDKVSSNSPISQGTNVRSDNVNSLSGLGDIPSREAVVPKESYTRPTQDYTPVNRNVAAPVRGSETSKAVSTPSNTPSYTRPTQPSNTPNVQRSQDNNNPRPNVEPSTRGTNNSMENSNPRTYTKPYEPAKEPQREYTRPNTTQPSNNYNNNSRSNPEPQHYNTKPQGNPSPTRTNEAPSRSNSSPSYSKPEAPTRSAPSPSSSPSRSYESQSRSSSSPGSSNSSSSPSRSSSTNTSSPSRSR